MPTLSCFPLDDLTCKRTGGPPPLHVGRPRPDHLFPDAPADLRLDAPDDLHRDLYHPDHLFLLLWRVTPKSDQRLRTRRHCVPPTARALGAGRRPARQYSMPRELPRAPTPRRLFLACRHLRRLHQLRSRAQRRLCDGRWQSSRRVGR